MIGRHPNIQKRWVHRARKGTVALVFATAIGALSGLALNPQPAHALFEGNGMYVKGVGAQSVGGFWLGAYTAPHNVETRYPVWCTHMWRANPKPQDTASITDLGESKRWGPDELDLSTAQMAWLLDRYQDDRHQENRAALSFLIHANFEGDQSGKNTQDSVNSLVDGVRRQLPQVFDRAKDYVRQAKESAVTTYENGSVETQTPRSGVLKDLGVKNEKGEWIPKLKLHLMLIGPARFTSTGTSQWDGETQGNALSLEWEATGNGTVKWVGNYENPVRSTLTKYGVNPATQDTASYGNRPGGDKEEKRLKGGTWKVLMDFQPMGRSQVVQTSVKDNTLSDTVTAFADPNYGDGKWINDEHGPIPVTFEGTAYDLGSEPPNEPLDVRFIAKDMRVLGSATVVFRGEGERQVSIPLPEGQAKPGFVSWVWRVRKEAQGQYAPLIHADWADQLGLTHETQVIPWKIQIHSAAQLKETNGGDFLIDDLWVSGFPEGHTYWSGSERIAADTSHMRHRLLFFPQGLEVVEENREKAEEIGAVEVPAKNGYYPSLGDLRFAVDPQRIGTYVFTTEFDGDGRVEAFRSSVEDPHEQYTRQAPSIIRLATRARDGGDGDQVIGRSGPSKIVDQVCYEGLEAGERYSLKANVVDRESGEPLSTGGRLVEGTAEFTAETASGCAEVMINVQGEDIKSKSVVIFEDLFHGDQRIAFHRDINAAQQTLNVEQPKPPKVARTGTSGVLIASLAGVGALAGGVLYRREGKELVGHVDI